MKILDILKKILSPNTDSRLLSKLKTVQDLEIFDTVWLKSSDGVINKGWIFDLTKKHIIVVIYDKNGNSTDYRFNITRPLDQTQLIQNNNVLLFNEPCMPEK